MEVEYTAAFLRQLRRLNSRYRHIREAIEPIINKLRAGEVLGDQIPHTGLTLFKVRVPNRDSRRGKRGGYRMIYWLRPEQRIILVTIYAKSDQGDVTAAEIRMILAEHEVTG